MKINMLYQKFKCRILYTHIWVTIARETSYCTVYTDKDYKKYWIMNFYQCSCCKKRKYTDNYNSYGSHHGMELAKINWIELGILPDISNVYNEPIVDQPKKSAKILKFECIDGDKI